MAARVAQAGGVHQNSPPVALVARRVRHRPIPGCASGLTAERVHMAQLMPATPPGGGVVGPAWRLLGGALRLDVVPLGSGRGDLRLDVGGVRVGRRSPDGTPAHRVPASTSSTTARVRLSSTSTASAE